MDLFANARVHDQLTVFRAFVRSVKPPEVQAPKNCDLTFLRFLVMVLPSTEGTVVPELQLRRLCKISLLILNKSGQAADFLFLQPPQFP